MTRKRLNVRIQPHQAFGRAVRVTREERGLSQERLGELSGLDRTYISGIERGMRNPTVQVVWIIAEGLGATPEALVGLANSIMNAEQP